MTTAILPAPVPTTPATPAPKSTQKVQPYRWTVQKFHDACMKKVWGDGKRMILIRGELYEVSPMNPLHASALVPVLRVMLQIVPANFELRQQSPLVLDLETDPIPDYAVVPGSYHDYLQRHPTTARLVVEIADSTFTSDITTKAELYATGNIPEYWVIDLGKRRLFVLREPTPLPTNGGQYYRSQIELTDKDTVTSLVAPDKPIRVVDLLP